MPDLTQFGGVLLKTGGAAEHWNFGWRHDPVASARFVASLPHPTFAEAAPHLQDTGTAQDVFAWDLEQRVLGRLISPWNQGSIGSCVAQGWGRAVQDLLLAQIALGNLEQWPGAELCREAIYGGSRVEIGHESFGEGSVGAWAADWVRRYGILLYQAYPGFDLTSG
jgi:hypothetical protein